MLIFLSGDIEPSLSLSSLPASLIAALQTYRGTGRHVVMLARGGKSANKRLSIQELDEGSILVRKGRLAPMMIQPDDGVDLSFVLYNRELAKRLAKDTVVVAIGEAGSWSKRIRKCLPERVVMLPYLDFNYSEILPHVDLVVHHGKLTWLK